MYDKKIEHDRIWALMSSILVIAMAAYMILNEILRLSGLIAVFMMLVSMLFMSYMYVMLLSEMEQIITEEALAKGLKELGED